MMGTCRGGSWRCSECGHDITTTDPQSVEHDTACSLHTDNEVNAS